MLQSIYTTYITRIILLLHYFIEFVGKMDESHNNSSNSSQSSSSDPTALTPPPIATSSDSTVSDTSKAIPWAHIDMAGPVWNNETKSPTGWGVRFLVDYILNNK